MLRRPLSSTIHPVVSHNTLEEFSARFIKLHTNMTTHDLIATYVTKDSC